MSHMLNSAHANMTKARFPRLSRAISSTVRCIQSMFQAVEEFMAQEVEKYELSLNLETRFVP